MASASDEFRKHWRLVLGATIGTCCGSLSWYTFGVFVSPLSRALGCSISALTGWASFVALGQIAVGPLTGRLADRFGVRVVMLFSIPLLALAFVSVCAIGTSVWLLYLAAFTVGCVSLGAGYLPYSRAVNSWFSDGRGTALGIMYSGVGISATFAPRVLQRIVDLDGWRMGFLFLAGGTLAALPVAFFWVHEKKDELRSSGSEIGYTRREAMRLPHFWMISAGTLMLSLCAGFIFHLIPFLTDSGLNRSQAAMYSGLMGIALMVGRLITGVLMDRFHAPYVCAVLFLSEAVALAILGLFQAHYAPIAVFVIGFSLGAETNCIAYCTMRYFGLKSYCELSGIFNIAICIGHVFGPLSFSLVKNATGSYSIGFVVWGGLAAVGAVLFTLVGRRSFRF